MTPVEWVSSNKFSYISEGNIYVYDVDTQKKQTLNVQAKSYESRFESTPAPLIPRWSKDGRYVFYYTDQAPMIYDTQTHTAKKVGVRKEEDNPAIGWVSFFEPYPFRTWITNNQVLVGTQFIDSQTLATTSFGRYSHISSDGKYRASYKELDGDLYQYKFFNEKNEEICRNLVVGPSGFGSIELMDPTNFIALRLEGDGDRSVKKAYVVDLINCTYISQKSLSDIISIKNLSEYIIVK